MYRFAVFHGFRKCVQYNLPSLFENEKSLMIVPTVWKLKKKRKENQNLTLKWKQNLYPKMNRDLLVLH